MYFLKLLGRPLLEYLQPLFQACFHFSYHPLHFKLSSTVALRKPGKGDYSAPAAWIPVALLNSLGKVLETVVARRKTALSEVHGPLSPQHMGARPGRTSDTELYMLVKQTHAAWQADDGVASLLYPDMTGALDRVVPVKFISSFLFDRSTSLCFPGFLSSPSLSEQGVPQGSSLSPILFLLYNADLINACNCADLTATGISFVDDANVRASGKSTEETSSILKEIHSCCLTGGDMHGPSFAPNKFVLVHFRKKKQNLPNTPLDSPLLPFTAASMLAF